jgi:hypothetical protein
MMFRMVWVTGRPISHFDTLPGRPNYRRACWVTSGRPYEPFCDHPYDEPYDIPPFLGFARVLSHLTLAYTYIPLEKGANVRLSKRCTKTCYDVGVWLKRFRMSSTSESVNCDS